MEQVWETSDNKTADAVVKAAHGIFGSLILIGDGTNLATAVLYDNASAATGVVVARAATKESTQIFGPVQCANGIYLDIGGTGAAAVVLYR